MNELAVTNPSEQFRLSTDVAGVCAAIVKQTAVSIQNKKYVKAEGWNAIAAAHGCSAGIREVTTESTGVKAIAELRRLHDGSIISTAEGFVGEDEPKWANGPEYARRAMAQTRAISRVCRSAFAHVVVLIDAGLSTTPAEEVPDNGFDNGRSNGNSASLEARQAEAKAINEYRLRGSGPQKAKSVVTDEHIGNWQDAICTYGRSDGPIRGKQLGDLNGRTLQMLYDKFVQGDPEIEPKDQNMRDGLSLWKASQQKSAKGLRQFEASQEQEQRALEQDQIPMDKEEW